MIQPKRIGLLGGMTEAATWRYIESLQAAGVASHDILYRMLDFGRVSELQSTGCWDQLGDWLLHEADGLAAEGAGTLAICSSTAHRAVEGRETPAPLIHIADACGRALAKDNRQHVLTLGTSLNAADVAYGARIRAAGPWAVAPEAELQRALDAYIFEGVARDGVTDQATAGLVARVRQAMRAPACDAVLLACTDLGVLKPHLRDVAVYDAVESHIAAILAECGG